jgi:lipooligosaccharide transport system permease protein
VTGLFLHVIERNVVAYRRMWVMFATGFAEPFLYLLSIGIGVGHLVGQVPFAGGHVPYEDFVAPGLLASAAMNGAVLDTTFNFFFKYKYAKTFDAMLATPLGTTDIALGEMGWALLRGTIYAAAFLATMAALGLVHSGWAVLALPASMLIGFAFAGVGMAATTYMRSFVDFDYVNMTLIPLFLFSATFFPLTRFPVGLQWVVRCTPLYQGVALQRALILGHVDWTVLVNVAYLALMGAIGVRVAGKRLGRLLKP